MARRSIETQRGFTLVELVVVIIILAVLSAVALPRFLNIGTSARVAAVSAMGGAVRSAANTVYAACVMANPAAANGTNIFVAIGDRVPSLHYCWPDAGDTLGIDQIDTWVTYQGFTATLVSGETLFMLNGAPDPANCSILYGDAQTRGPTLGFDIVQTTTGC